MNNLLLQKNSSFAHKISATNCQFRNITQSCFSNFFLPHDYQWMLSLFLSLRAKVKLVVAKARHNAENEAVREPCLTLVRPVKL